MRNVVLTAVLAWGISTGWSQPAKNAQEPKPEAKPETIARWSFAGTKALAENKELQVFNAIRSLTNSVALRDAAATNLAHLAAQRFASIGKPTNAAPIAGAAESITAILQPLVADLVQHQSRFQLDTHGAQDADWFLAVRLPEARASAWSKSLAQLALFASLKGAASEKADWVASRENYKLALSRFKEWTIIEGGANGPAAKGAKAFRDSLSKSSGKSILDAEINPSLLAKISNRQQLAHFPKLSLRAEPRRDGFFSEAMLDYPQDLGIKPEKWNAPGELIQEPLMGFTAIQGIQKKLESWPAFKSLGAAQTPNQFFTWGQDIGPFTIFAAAEVKNPGQIVSNTFRAFEQKSLPMGQLQLATNRVVWFGLPVAVPYLEAAEEPHSSFAVAGLFPFKQPSTKPAPKDLLQQLEQKNLVYYDWEITGNRVKQWIPIWQLRYLINAQFAPDNSAPSASFLQALKGKVGNSVTQGTLENSRRIKFTRQSHLGLTALELTLLAHSLDPADLSRLRPTPGQPQQKSFPAPPQ